MTTPAAEDDDATFLYDATFPRVDLVGKAANGVPRFLVAKEQDGAGLLDAGFVRSLISKSEPGTGSEEQITVSGSPAAIAKMIHAAAQKPVAKADMSTKSINDLPDSAFAYIEPGGQKDADGKTTPRSLRHFPVNDAAHVRNALSRAPQSPFGDKAMPKIRAAAKKFDIDVAKALAEDGLDETEIVKMLAEPVTKDMGPDLDDTPDQMDAMDVTVPLAAPDTDAPGDPTDPGSPAWEAIDAATACKWTSILSRARVAIDILADRELLEAASADPDDAENAWDLQDVCCAIDYAISVLAPFAVAEQSEADCGTDAMAAIGKAMAGFDMVPMDRIEALAQVAKAGRVLSSANEGLIRDAASKLQSVLASLPAAPQADDSGLPVAKQQEDQVTATATEPVAKDAERTPEQQAADSGPVSAGGTTGMGQTRDTGPAAALPGDGPQSALPGDVPGRQVVKGLPVGVFDHRRRLVGVVASDAIVTSVAKAGGDNGADDGDKTMQAVFDQDGNLIGIVDPSAITPVSGAGKKPGDGDGKDGDGDMPDAKDGADSADLTPQPSGDAGTPADQVGKQASTTSNDDNESTEAREVLKGIVLEAMAEANADKDTAEVVSKADHAALLEEVSVLKARLKTVEESEARPKTFASGQTPPPGQLRGQDRPEPGQAPRIDVAKAAERRKEFYAADPADQNRIAGEMQQDAINVLSAIHSAPRR